MNRQVPTRLVKKEAIEGELLFSNFIKEELEHEGFTEDYLIPEVSRPNTLLASPPLTQGYSQLAPNYIPEEQEIYTPVNTNVGTPEGYSSPEFAVYGKIIRELADEFSKSKERIRLSQVASKVDIENTDKSKFFELLEKVFLKGVSRERLVALFFFCSDLLINAARKKLKEVCVHFFLWSLEYISDHVSVWVQEHGGWEKVLRNIWEMPIFKIVLISVFMAGIGFGLYYIQNIW